MTNANLGQASTDVSTISISLDDINARILLENPIKWYRENVIYYCIEPALNGHNPVLDSRGNLDGERYKIITALVGKSPVTSDLIFVDIWMII